MLSALKYVVTCACNIIQSSRMWRTPPPFSMAIRIVLFVKTISPSLTVRSSSLLPLEPCVTTDGRMQIGGTRRLVTMRSSGRQKFGFMSRSCKGMNYKKKTDSVKAVQTSQSSLLMFRNSVSDRKGSISSESFSSMLSISGVSLIASAQSDTKFAEATFDFTLRSCTRRS